VQSQPFGQRGGHAAGMRDRAFVIERGIDVIENDVRGSHRKGAFGSDE
jgi:hypothetical protein